MKKFLTLALALVMALALAAPAMAFVDYDYGTASAYDLDFYLVDYDESYNLFNRGGVWTELPAADRGYVTNEMVGAVAEVLVPANNAGGDAGLKITGENVRLYQGITSVGTQWVDEAVTSKTTAEKLETVNSKYYWTYVKADEELVLSISGFERDIFQNTTNKDVVASWLVFGKVLDEDASLTATLFHGKYNTALKDAVLGVGSSADYKINGRKYKVQLDKIAGDGYVYTITQTDGDFSNGSYVMYLYTNSDYKTQSMVVTTNGGVTYGGQKGVYSIAVANWGNAADKIEVGSSTFQVAANTAGTANIYGGLTTLGAVANAINAAGVDTSFTWSAEGENLVIVEKAIAAVGGTPAVATTITSLTANGVSVTPLTFTARVTGQAMQQVAAGATYYEVGKDGKLYLVPTTASYVPAEGRPALSGPAVTDIAGSAFAAQVNGDFGMSPALVGNVLKPAYLGQYRLGTIEEITLDIQPWQAYVTIPDIEVIDPPKTGDAATLAGFVMIVLAAAGVVVFKKVRA